MTITIEDLKAKSVGCCGVWKSVTEKTPRFPTNQMAPMPHLTTPQRGARMPSYPRTRTSFSGVGCVMGEVDGIHSVWR